MQNRYVGDIGDFGKYGLLRYLTGQFDQLAPLRLGIVWYLYPDESHNNDGSNVRYLTKGRAGRFEPCDPDLYNKLRAIVSTRRHVREVRRRRILPLGTRFFEQELTFAGFGRGNVRQKVEHRHAWVAAALQSTATCDIVFLDPDNGIECKSVRPYSARGPKYAFRHEILPIIDRAQTLVVYHHTSRQNPADAQIGDHLDALRSLTSSANGLYALRFRRGSSRAFMIVPSSQHGPFIAQRLKAFIRSPWKEHFDLIYQPGRHDDSSLPS